MKRILFVISLCWVALAVATGGSQPIAPCTTCFSEISALATQTDYLGAYARRYANVVSRLSPADGLALLRRADALPTDRKSARLQGKPPVIVASEEKVRHHGDGGQYHYDYDQYGNTYFSGPDGPDTLPTLALYFNLPQREPSLPTAQAHFLRETTDGFDRSKLTPQEIARLDPLPQADPLRSYIGVSLVRIFTREHDKPMPPFDPHVDPRGMYEPGRNYYRRGDGTYYIYDIAPGQPHVFDIRAPKTNRMYTNSPEGFMKIHADQILKAIGTVPAGTERTKAIDFYLDSIFAFPEIGKGVLRESVERAATAQTAYERARTAYEAMPAWRRWLTEPPSPPWDYGFTGLSEIAPISYFVLPVILEHYYVPSSDPVKVEFLARFQQRIRRYRDDFDAFYRENHEALGMKGPDWPRLRNMM